MSGASTNYIIIIDGTNSMCQKDFRPNRFRVALKGIKIFMEEKQRVSPDSFFSLLIGGKQTLVLSSLCKDTKDIEKQVFHKTHQRKYEINGSCEDFIFTFDFAFEMVDEHMKKIGGHETRIMVVSSDFNLCDSSKIEEFLKKAQTLHIQMDLFILNNNIPSNLDSQYKRIAKETHGEYFRLKTKSEFFSKMKHFAHTSDESQKKLVLHHPLEKTREDHMEEIAQSLRRPTEEELKKLAGYNKSIICKICFAKDSKMLPASTKLTLRFCPVCDTPMHLYCASMWSLKTYHNSNLIRCPYCYNLLKVPVSIKTGLKVQQTWNNKGDDQPLLIKMVLLKNDSKSISEIDDFSECYYCFKVLNPRKENGKIFTCSKCSALYHETCLHDMYRENKICKNCGGKIV